MTEEKKDNGQSEKSKAKIINSPTEPFSALEEIQGRAPVGGKVAMIERGAKEAKVINMSKKSSKKPTKAKVAPPAGVSPDAIPISKDGIEDVREAQAEVDRVHLEMGRNLALFFSTVKQLDEQSTKSQENFRATIKRLRKKSGAPDDYVLNLDQWVFMPNPNAQPQMPMMPSRPANN